MPKFLFFVYLIYCILINYLVEVPSYSKFEMVIFSVLRRQSLYLRAHLQHDSGWRRAPLTRLQYLQQATAFKLTLANLGEFFHVFLFFSLSLSLFLSMTASKSQYWQYFITFILYHYFSLHSLHSLTCFFFNTLVIFTTYTTSFLQNCSGSAIKHITSCLPRGPRRSWRCHGEDLGLPGGYRGVSLDEASHQRILLLLDAEILAVLNMRYPLGELT